MKRMNQLAWPSASSVNRVLDAAGKLQTFHCGAWGESYGSGLVYHNATMGLGHLTSQVVDSPAGGWEIPFGTKPVWGGGTYRTVMQAYENASVMRVDRPIPAGLTGKQFLLNGSSLRAVKAGGEDDEEAPMAPGVVRDASVGHVYSDRLRTAPYDEDPGSTIITFSPDNWAYPGGRDRNGRPWAQNPNEGVSLDTPYWNFVDAPDALYMWWPAVFPIGHTTQQVSGGFDPIGGWHGYIHANIAPIGIPMVLQVGPRCRVTSAKSELSFVGGSFYQLAIDCGSAQDYRDHVGWVVTTLDIDIAMVLLAGKTAFYGEENEAITHWHPVGNFPAGVATDGKTSVVDVTEPLKVMMDLSDGGEYDSFGILPSVGVEFLGGANAGALKGLMGAEPELSWDEGERVWYISKALLQTISWTSYAISAPVVTALWPDSVKGRSVPARALPVMD